MRMVVGALAALLVLDSTPSWLLDDSTLASLPHIVLSPKLLALRGDADYRRPGLSIDGQSPWQARERISYHEPYDEGACGTFRDAPPD